MKVWIQSFLEIPLTSILKITAIPVFFMHMGSALTKYKYCLWFNFAKLMDFIFVLGIFQEVAEAMATTLPMALESKMTSMLYLDT